MVNALEGGLGGGLVGRVTQTPTRSFVFVARAAGMALARVLQSELAKRRTLVK